MLNKRSQSNCCVDIHCHILPGLDDGSKDMEETLQMLKHAQEQGIIHIIATPHHKAGRRNASPQTIKKRMDDVRIAAEERDIHVKLYPGNEILFYSDLENVLEKNIVQTLNDTEYMLVEFLPGNEYTYIRNAVSEIQGMGYTPILAHVERYDCLLKHTKYVKELHDMGVEIQVNAASVTGKLGGTCRQFVHELLKKEIVDYVATDAHDCHKRMPDIEKCRKILNRKYGESYTNRILYENAYVRLLKGNT